MSTSDSEYEHLEVSSNSTASARLVQAASRRAGKRRNRTVSVGTLKNEIEHREVEDVTLEAFYRPHNITLLVIAVAAVVASAFIRSEVYDYQSNLFAGFCGVTVYFLIIAILAFPNGPFTRPHPVFWRLVFGLSVIYLMLIQFLIQQDYATVRGIIVWVDPKMENYTLDMEKEYGENCNDITWERLWGHLDWFAFGHYWGWGMKALIIRHYGICWSVSVMWELTEMVFGHLLPNFYECWWDNLVLDVLICNALGIFTGMQVCKFLEMRAYHWESIKNINSSSGKLKRALLQFTPESWSSTRWMDPSCSWMRVLAVSAFIFCWQTVELNTFFVKHIFPMPVEHPICVARILLLGIMAAPATRQYYSFVTDKTCDRIGSQCWVFLAISISELIFHIKFGLDLFSHTQISKMVIWIILNIVISCAGLFISVWIWKRRTQQKEESVKVASDSPSMNTRSRGSKQHATFESTTTTPSGDRKAKKID